MENGIPSPFKSTTFSKAELHRELSQLMDKYGYAQWFIVLGTDIDAETETWTSDISEYTSDGMVECLRGKTDILQGVMDGDYNDDDKKT